MFGGCDDAHGAEMLVLGDNCVIIGLDIIQIDADGFGRAVPFPQQSAVADRIGDAGRYFL